MKASTIQWHVARDNRLKLARFCEKFNTRTQTELFTATVGDDEFFQIMYTFDNGGYIVAELLHGKKDIGYTVNDHFKVIDYETGV